VFRGGSTEARPGKGIILKIPYPLSAVYHVHSHLMPEGALQLAMHIDILWVRVNSDFSRGYSPRRLIHAQ
jgi:hypothetical protein